MSIAPTVIERLWRWTQAEAPREACGILFGDEHGYFDGCQCVNYAPDPTEEFWMNPHDLEEPKQRYLHIALWHSHPTSRAELSSSDRQVMGRTLLPMVVVAAKPYPSVVVYGFHQGREIIRTEVYRVERASDSLMSRSRT